MKKAIIISCSQRKFDRDGYAINVYDGNMFRILKQYKPHLEVFIMSAGYGLIDAMHFIEKYDKKINEVARQDQIDDAWVQARSPLMESLSMQDHIYVVMGWDYLKWLLTICQFHKEAYHTLFTTPANSLYNRLDIRSLTCKGNGEMQRVLVDLCAENVDATRQPLRWHTAVEKHERKD